MNSLPVYKINSFEHQEESSLFYASKFQRHIKRHGFVNEAHGHNFYLTVLFTSGFGVHEVDFKRYAIVPGSLFTLKPGQVHFWKFSKNIDGYIFFHGTDFFDLLYSERSILSKHEFFLNRKSPAIWLDKEKQDVMEELLEKLTNEYYSRSTFKKERVCAIAFLIYLELTEFDDNHLVSENNNLNYLNKIRILEELINDNFKALKLPHQYADMMNMTPKHLNRICKNILGTTATQLIIQRIVLEGKRLLVNPEYSISDIAEILGYDDPSYFTKVFKKSTGVSPNNFRNA